MHPLACNHPSTDVGKYSVQTYRWCLHLRIYAMALAWSPSTLHLEIRAHERNASPSRTTWFKLPTSSTPAI